MLVSLEVLLLIFLPLLMHQLARLLLLSVRFWKLREAHLIITLLTCGLILRRKSLFVLWTFGGRFWLLSHQIRWFQGLSGLSNIWLTVDLKVKRIGKSRVVHSWSWKLLNILYTSIFLSSSKYLFLLFFQKFYAFCILNFFIDCSMRVLWFFEIWHLLKCLLKWQIQNGNINLFSISIFRCFRISPWLALIDWVEIFI